MYDLSPIVRGPVSLFLAVFLAIPLLSGDHPARDIIGALIIGALLAVGIARSFRRIAKAHAC